MKERPLIGETNSSTTHAIALPPNHYESKEDYVSRLYEHVKDGAISYVDLSRYRIELFFPFTGLKVWNYILYAGAEERDRRLFDHLSRILGVRVKMESYDPYIRHWEEQYLKRQEEDLSALVEYVLNHVETKEDLNVMLNGIVLIDHDAALDYIIPSVIDEVGRLVGKGFLVYCNSPYYIAINPHTGTKYRFVDIYEEDTDQHLYGFVRTLYPESIDLNISYRCDIGCPYCYINATPDGEEVVWDENLKGKVKALFEDRYTWLCPPFRPEVAINVNNLFDYRTLVNITRQIKEMDGIPNLTLHYRTAVSHPELFALDSVYWIGVSVTSHRQVEHVRSLYPGRNVVFHVINGVFDGIERVKGEKVLLLGYKTSGRGKTYSPRLWKWETVETLRKNGNIVAMDDLAIKQLEARKHLSRGEWDRFFMGWDYTHSMFIDLVRGVFAENSHSSEGFPIYGKGGKVMSVRKMWMYLQDRRWKEDRRHRG